MGVRDLAYSLYERRLLASLDPQQRPHHVGVILDGNRRWARASGTSASSGHQAGADKIAALLEWCDDAGVELVTLWLLSTENLTRPEPELSPPSQPPSQPQLLGQQVVTVTGTCLHTQRGTQRVTVYGTHFGTHFETWMVRW